MSRSMVRLHHGPPIYPSLKTYELIEHTADIGVRIKARSLKGLFKNSALAMFDIMARKQKKEVPAGKTFIVHQSAVNREELLISWLNELLSLSAVKGVIFSAFTIKKLGERSLEATVKGEDINSYKVETEIKAATFNGLVLKKSRSGWLARMVFDV